MRTSVEVSFKFDEAIQHPMRGTAVWVVRVASRTSEQFFGHASAGTRHDFSPQSDSPCLRRVFGTRTPADKTGLIAPTLDHLQHWPSRAALRLRITYQRGQR